MTSTYSRIRATGTSLSDRALTNGVASQVTIGQAEVASRQALDDAGLAPVDIDFLVIGTTSPDIVFPNGGCLLQERLGIRGCAAFSVEAGPAGFIYALSIADRFIASGQATCALVIGADTLSDGSVVSDRETPANFAAAAGAIVVEAASQPGIVSCHLGADRRHKQSPPEIAAQNQADNVHADGFAESDTGAFQSAVDSLRTNIDENLDSHKLATDDIIWMIPQQTDPTAIQAMAHGLGISLQKVIAAPEDHGDMVTAAIPWAFDLGIREGRISDGDLLLLTALGGAGTWGSALIRY